MKKIILGLMLLAGAVSFANTNTPTSSVQKNSVELNFGITEITKTSFSEKKMDDCKWYVHTTTHIYMILGYVVASDIEVTLICK